VTAPFRDLFSKGAPAYARHRPVYPESLYAYLAKLTASHERAWDCATGSGQAARGLAVFFREVVATDASAAQLACAPSHPRIRYRTAPAECSGLDPASVDLVSVAQAMHWFDVPRFHAEVRRVARPDAVVAVWGYGRLTVAPEIDAVLEQFHDDVVGPFWPPERRHIDDQYARLAWPFRSLDAPPFEIRTKLGVEDLVGYLGTWSAVRRYRDQRCVDPLPRLRAALLEAWGDPAAERAARWPLFLKLGRLEGKPASVATTG
jgi:SAM-dependent methyltransferase